MEFKLRISSIIEFLIQPSQAGDWPYTAFMLYQHTMFVALIVGIAAYMRAFIYKPGRLARASRLFRDNAATQNQR